MTAYDWCAGMHPQPPHVVEVGDLIRIRQQPPTQLCRRCWSLWIRTDAGVDHAP
jgi:hypothetical protein